MTTNSNSNALPRGWYLVVEDRRLPRLFLRPLGASSTPVVEGKTTPEGTYAYLPSMAHLDGELEVDLRTGWVTRQSPAWLPEMTEWPMHITSVFPMGYESLSATRTPEADEKATTAKGDTSAGMSGGDL